MYGGNLHFLVDLYEGPSGTSGVLQRKNSILELYLGVEPRNAFIQNQDLVRAVPSDLGTLLLH